MSVLSALPRVGFTETQCAAYDMPGTCRELGTGVPDDIIRGQRLFGPINSLVAVVARRWVVPR